VVDPLGVIHYSVTNPTLITSGFNNSFGVITIAPPVFGVYTAGVEILASDIFVTGPTLTVTTSATRDNSSTIQLGTAAPTVQPFAETQLSLEYSYGMIDAMHGSVPATNFTPAPP
jgi:hypothetical protein